MIRTTVLMLGTRYLPGYFYHLPSGSDNPVPVMALKYPGKQTGLTQISITSYFRYKIWLSIYHGNTSPDSEKVPVGPLSSSRANATPVFAPSSGVSGA